MSKKFRFWGQNYDFIGQILGNFLSHWFMGINADKNVMIGVNVFKLSPKYNLSQIYGLKFGENIINGVNLVKFDHIFLT